LGIIPNSVQIEILPQHMEALRADGGVRLERTSTN